MDEPDGEEKDDANDGPIVKFLNTPLGLAVLGFFLTTVVGGTLTYWAHSLEWSRQVQQQDFEKQQDEKTATHKYAIAQDRILRSQIAQPLLQRLLYTEMMAQVFGRPTTAKEFAETWASYWQSYRDYFTFIAGNEIPRDRGFGPPAPYLDSHPVLWRYLDDVIAPEFETIHGCVVKAQLAYHAASAKPNEGADKFFKSCITANNSNHPFWNYSKDKKITADTWGRFKGCVDTFILQVEDALVWREQLAGEANQDETPPAGNVCPPEYKGGRWCRETHFNQDIYKWMYLDCGLLTDGDENEVGVSHPKDLNKDGLQY